MSGCLTADRRPGRRRSLLHYRRMRRRPAVPCLLALWVLPAVAAAYRVDFEGPGETKGGYASGIVTLNGLDWELTEALIGTLGNDKKNGLRSLRMRRSGDTNAVAAMTRDKPDGIGRISFLYARYGTDTGQPNLTLEYSANAGTDWTAIGAVITNFPDTLTQWAAAVNLDCPARIRLRADSSGSGDGRLNLDDLELTDPGDALPLVTTAAIADVRPTGACAGGEVVDDGGTAVTLRGVVWNLGGAPDTNDHVVAVGAGKGVFTVELAGLSPGQIYYVRAFAENAHGVGYGVERSFRAACFTNAPVLDPVVQRHRGGFTVTWRPLAGAVGYRVEIASDACFHPGGVATIFHETMGETVNHSTLAAHAAAGGFDHSGVFSFGDGGADQAAEVRPTESSSGYTNAAGATASGGANVFFSETGGDRGFEIGGIDTRGYSNLRLSFGYRKEASASNASYAVYASVDGTIWQTLSLEGMPADDALIGWYLIPDLALPPAADNVDALRLRWIKRGAVRMRIDDVLLRGDGGAATLHPEHAGVGVAATAYRVHKIASGTWWIRVRAVSAAGCVSAVSAAQSVQASMGGTLVLFK